MRMERNVHMAKCMDGAAAYEQWFNMAFRAESDQNWTEMILSLLHLEHYQLTGLHTGWLVIPVIPGIMVHAPQQWVVVLCNLTSTPSSHHKTLTRAKSWQRKCNSHHPLELLALQVRRKVNQREVSRPKKKTPIITSESEEMTKLLWPVNAVAGWLFNKLAHC